MNKRLSVEGRLSVEEWEGQDRQARDGGERSHWQLRWLAAQGRTCQAVAALTGSGVPWVRERSQRSTRQGPAGSGDRRPATPGHSGRRSKEQQTDRAPALEGPRPPGGRWRGPPVAGRRGEARATRAESLAATGLGLPAPAGGHPAAPPATATATARQRRRGRPRGVQGGALAAARETVPPASPTDPIARWGSDAHRVGRKPIRRGVWARRGPRGVTPVQPRAHWTALSGCVRPRTGQPWWLLRPTVRADRFRLARAQFAPAVGAGQGKPGLGLRDRAGGPLSAPVQVPAGVHLVWLPPSSPA